MYFDILYLNRASGVFLVCFLLLLFLFCFFCFCSYCCCGVGFFLGGGVLGVFSFDLLFLFLSFFSLAHLIFH